MADGIPAKVIPIDPKQRHDRFAFEKNVNRARQVIEQSSYKVKQAVGTLIAYEIDQALARLQNTEELQKYTRQAIMQSNIELLNNVGLVLQQDFGFDDAAIGRLVDGLNALVNPQPAAGGEVNETDGQPGGEEGIRPAGTGAEVAGEVNNEASPGGDEGRAVGGDEGSDPAEA